MEGSKENRSGKDSKVAAIPEKDNNVREVKEKIPSQNGSSIESTSINDAILESLYSQAYRLYNSGKYDDASYIFRMLQMLNALDPKYLMGLAACQQMLKNYKQAVQAYFMCGIIDPKNPAPHYYASDCFINLNDPLSAIVSLELTIKRAGDNPKYKVMKDRAVLSLESLKKNLDIPPEEKKE